jgi:hypothetical protein
VRNGTRRRRKHNAHSVRVSCGGAAWRNAPLQARRRLTGTSAATQRRVWRGRGQRNAAAGGLRCGKSTRSAVVGERKASAAAPARIAARPAAAAGAGPAWRQCPPGPQGATRPPRRTRFAPARATLRHAGCVGALHRGIGTHLRQRDKRLRLLRLVAAALAVAAGAAAAGAVRRRRGRSGREGGLGGRVRGRISGGRAGSAVSRRGERRGAPAARQARRGGAACRPAACARRARRARRHSRRPCAHRGADRRARRHAAAQLQHCSRGDAMGRGLASWQPARRRARHRACRADGRSWRILNCRACWRKR